MSREGILFSICGWSYLTLFNCHSFLSNPGCVSKCSICVKVCKQDLCDTLDLCQTQRLYPVLPFFPLCIQVGAFWKGTGQCPIILTQGMCPRGHQPPLYPFQFHHPMCSSLGTTYHVLCSGLSYLFKHVF